MKKITLFSVLAVLFAAMSFTSCNSSSDNSAQLPTQQEAYAMMQKIAGYGSHNCGILFPEDTKNNITKDSVTTSITITPADSTYRIANFPVSLLAKYVKNEKLSNLIKELPNQTLTGKLYCMSSTTPFFYSLTQNITFTDETGNKYTLAFYGGYSNYSMAGIAQDNKHFLMYLTPGAIYNGTEIMNDVLKTQVGTYGSAPYTMFLRYALN